MASSKARSKRRPASSGSARAGRGGGRDAARTKAAVSATPNSARQPVKLAPAPAPEPRQSAPAEQPGEAASPLSGRPPLWLQLVTFALAIAGLGVSSYETWAHFNGNQLFACKANGSENCTAVITSPESMVFGVIPVAILGLLFYIAVVAIMSPWGWRIQRREVHLFRLASMVVGMGFVMYLIYAELHEIGAWCLYCTSVHIITFLLFCITVLSAAIWGLGQRRDSVASS